MRFRANELGCCDVAREADACDLLCLDVPKAEAARRDNCPSSADWLRRWARRCQGTGVIRRGSRSPSHLRPLARTACVCDLAWIVGRDEKLVSHHARALRVAGLAGATRDGKMVVYEAAPTAAARC